ncbi:tyrosyl-tRNA synthetase [Tulasnella sp. 418]|nr:tyrosyl-tRNA synthetase [Tulasnella sp. 418]
MISRFSGYRSRTPLAVSLKHKQWRCLSSSSSDNVVNTLKSRNLVAQITSPELEKLSEKQKLTVYVGIDPSAKSLHLGNLLPLITLFHFHLLGHRIIALIGGATGSIGDPGGRSTERNLLSQDEVQFNMGRITNQVQRFFENAATYAQNRVGSPQASQLTGPTIVNNLDWLKDVGLLAFLRDVGKHAKVNQMVTRDTVRNRLNSQHGISFTEFSYQLLQAHDFHTLHEKYGCQVQIGGSDQWGNIVAGIDLIRRRKAEASSLSSEFDLENGTGDVAFGLTIPLLTNASGEKFGKSSGKAIWIDQGLTSIFDFYQYFVRLPDNMIERLLKMFTLLPSHEVESIMQKHEINRGSRQAQRALAREVTELVHGAKAVKQAEAASQALFENPRSINIADAVSALEGNPRLVRVKADEVVGQSLCRLAVQYGVCESRNKANQVMKTGGFYLNGLRMKDPRKTLQSNSFINGVAAVIRIGAHEHLVLHACS